MNIFATDPSATVSAEALDDLRLNKMITETAQMISTVLFNKGYVADYLYKPTHKNHPCVLWAEKALPNFIWLLKHGHAMNNERKFRFGDVEHMAHTKVTSKVWLEYVGGNTPEPAYFQNSSMFKSGDVFDAYKRTMIVKWVNDIRQPKWTRRGHPIWADQEVNVSRLSRAGILVV